MNEIQFSLYVKGVFFGRVWLKQSEMRDLFYIGRIRGVRHYKSLTKQGAVYTEITTGEL